MINGRKKHSNPILNFSLCYIEDIGVILIKGFIGCLVIFFPLELMGYDFLVGKTILTDFWYHLRPILVIGTILHLFFWKT